MKYLTIALCIFCYGGLSAGAQGIEIGNLKCEYLSSPVCIDTHTPRFTWEYVSIPSNVDLLDQSSVKIELFSEAQNITPAAKKSNRGKGGARATEGPLWSLDGLPGAVQLAKLDNPAVLSSNTRYFWRVTLTTADGTEVSSPMAQFRTAMLRQDDWKASWITDSHAKDYAPAPMMRKEFSVGRKPVEAYLYVSGAAYCDIHVNGTPAGPNRLDPGYTHYDVRNLYTVHDVTSLVNKGRNVLSATLGNGFYNEEMPVATWKFEVARWRNRPRFICELHITYSDGSTEKVLSDGSWKSATGPYISDNIYSGMAYDARLEHKGWREAGFDDSRWENAVPTKAPSPLLTAQKMPPIEVVSQLEAVDFRSWGDTLFVYNFGKNIPGLCRLEASAPRGTRVTMMHGEMRKSDGRVEMGNIDIYYKPLPGYALQTDTYYFSGEGVETYVPDFTYHGFQYVEVKSDRPIQLDQNSLTALVMHTAVEDKGTFRCSDELLNKIWDAARLSYLGNLHSIPTDCPQREKNGWTADAHVCIDLALLNYDGMTTYEKWLDDFVDNQRPDGQIAGIIPSAGWGYDDWISPVWDAAMFGIPYALYCYYGDTEPIEKIYDSCQRYLDYLTTREEANGLVTYGDLGDWLPYDTKTPTEFTTPCFQYFDYMMMARFARILGKDASAYETKALAIKDTINNLWLDRESAGYANGSQAALATALYMGIVPQEYEAAVARRLFETVRDNDYFLDFGTLGSKFVPRMLTKYGYADAAFKMATKRDAPSWGNWIELGYSTLAETWVLSPHWADASINHVLMGDIAAWMVNTLAGINHDETAPGFARFNIEPHFPQGLEWAEASYGSIRGEVASSWQRNGSEVTLTVKVPHNTEARVILPDGEYRVTGGTHHFKSTLNY